MATLFIAEYATLPQVSGGKLMIAPEPAIATQAVTYSTTAPSAAFNAQTRYIAITSPGIFSYTVAAAPTATTSHFRIAADQIIYLAVQPGDKIAAVTNT